MIVYTHSLSFIFIDLSGVTKRSIRPTNSSENQRFSEVFLFTPIPRSAQNIETAGVQKGGNKNCTLFCHLERFYFIIFQRYTKNKAIGYLPPRKVVAGGKG